MLEEELLPLAEGLATLMREAEGYGRAIVDVRLRLAVGAELSGGQRSPPGRRLHVAHEITVPADEDEVRPLALQ